MFTYHDILKLIPFKTIIYFLQMWTEQDHGPGDLISNIRGVTWKLLVVMAETAGFQRPDHTEFT